MTVNLLNPGCGDDDCYPCETPPCFCDDIPLTVTFSGATGCLSSLNGTYALSHYYGCYFRILTEYDPIVPPCAFSGTCHIDSRFRTSPERIEAYVYYNSVDNTCTAGINSKWWVSRTNVLNPTGCDVYPPSEANVVFARSGCTTGTMVYQSELLDNATLGTLPTACTIAF